MGILHHLGTLKPFREYRGFYDDHVQLYANGVINTKYILCHEESFQDCPTLMLNLKENQERGRDVNVDTGIPP
jgi:hypothetical protein